MMRIVHDAFRRDLDRVRAVVTLVPPPDRRQRVAIAEHLAWVGAFLEAHHRSEDHGLYPAVLQRDPGAAALLDAMAQDHARVATAIQALADAAARFVDHDDVRQLVAALDDLRAVLLPHLAREEEEVLPVIARALTNRDWDAIEQEHNLAGKSMSQLAREGHWLIDGAAADDRRRVLALVPPVPRVVILYGFGPSYRRQRRAWQRRHRTVQHEGSTSVVVPADIDSVWAVVRDPTRVAEWSHECVACEWVGDVTEARPGARFRGRNRQGPFRWGRMCEIVRAEPYEIVWRTVPTRVYPDSTEWALRLTSVDGGTRIEQTFRVVKGTLLEPVYATILPAHRDRTEALQHDLERIGALAGAAAVESY
jgi:hemerythrin-like domain-containing protein